MMRPVRHAITVFRNGEAAQGISDDGLDGPPASLQRRAVAGRPVRCPGRSGAVRCPGRSGTVADRFDAPLASIRANDLRGCHVAVPVGALPAYEA